MSVTRWIVKSRGTGDFDAADFELQQQGDLPSLGEGEIRVRVVYASADPTQLGWSRMDTYMPAVPLGDTMRALGVGVVEQSNDAAFPAGMRVTGMLGFTTHVQAAPAAIPFLSALPDTVSWEMAVACFNHIGSSAMALLKFGEPAEGETVLVTAAAGAVGGLAVQIAKAVGCRVVGVAGSDEKLQYVRDEYGADEVVNYRDEDFADKLRAACPSGVDVYFENVGGNVTTTAWPLLNNNARVVACGMIAHYTGAPPLPIYGPDIVAKRLRISGFVCMDFASEWPAMFARLGGWMAEGKVRVKLDIDHGVEQCIPALGDVLAGHNKGKKVIRISEPPAASEA